MKLKNNILVVLLVIALFGVFMPEANAASLVISFSSSTAKVGDTVTATVTGNGVSGRVSLSVSGNATLSKDSIFVDGSASVTVKITGEGNVKITATAADMAENANAKEYTGSTSGTIKVSSTSNENNSDKNEKTPTQTNTANNNSNNNEVSKSNNANLSNLGIKPNDFKGFKASKTSYDVTVPNDVEKVTVYATAQDNKAKIKGNESQKLKVGKNTLNVVVTAEDGTQKTYTINVTREEANQTDENTSNTTNNETSSEKTQESQSETNSDLKNLSIKGYTLNPAFSPNVYEYKVDVNGDVSSLDIETEGASHSVSVDIVGNENLAEGENTITVLVYNEETKQNSTYQIIVNKTNLDMTDINKTMNDAAKKAQKVRYITFGILAFIVVCIIAFVIVKKRLENKDEGDSNEDVELPKAIKNNDETDENEEKDEEELQRSKTKRKGKHF